MGRSANILESWVLEWEEMEEGQMEYVVTGRCVVIVPGITTRENESKKEKARDVQSMARTCNPTEFWQKSSHSVPLGQTANL